MNEKFDVNIISQPKIGIRENSLLSVTHNGIDWKHIEILDPEFEIPKIIKALKSHFIQIERKSLIKNAKNRLGRNIRVL